MNGAATRRGGSGGRGIGGAGYGGRDDFASTGQPRVGSPTGKVVMDSYRMDILNGFEKDKPRYNPSNTGRPQSSALVDLKDPIQVHLLTETALSDSKSYEILSQEEVDELKKQIQSLSMRVEQARANLAIQSKYRDAAISMARLYSPPKAEGKRRSLLGNRMSDSAKEAEMEKEASERRCEELATELFSLEKRLVEPQRRLLQHTAGILQMTHRAPSKKPGQLPAGPLMNAMPGSPESLYTYSNNRDSMEFPIGDFDFDDRSLNLALDQMDGQTQTARALPNTIEIPMKSPIREQNAQLRELREELERVKEENERILDENIELKTAEQQLKDDFTRAREEQNRLKSTEAQLREEQARARNEISRLQSREQELADEHARAVEESMRIKDETSRFKDADTRLMAIEQQMTAETESLRAQSAAQLKIISDAESNLEILNRKLRELILEFNPIKNAGFGNPEAAAGSGETLTGQLEYLEKGLAKAVEQQELNAADASRVAEDAAHERSAAIDKVSEVSASLDQASARVQGLASQMQLMLQQSDESHPSPPEALDEQIEYIEDALQIFASELSRALNASSSASAKSKNVEQVDAVLMGLWEIIQTGYAEMEQQRAARKQNRALGQSPVDDDDGDSSSNEDGYTNEPYSLQAFSAKVQWLYAQATGLREHKYILQRQIKQQRDLNNRSESEKDRELHAKKEELQQSNQLLDDAERAAHDALTKLERALTDMDTLQQTTAANEAASLSSTKSAQDQLKSHSTKLAALEADVREANARLATAESDKAAVESQLDEASSNLASADAELAALRSQLYTTMEASSAADAATAKLQAEIKAKDDELDQLNTMVIELKTEVAFAKAELDGAYGSRKQRAAEAAAISSKSGGQSSGEEHIARLKAELENALRDLEAITRESISGERERLEMEVRLDGAEAVRGELEAEVGRLRERVEGLQEGLDRERLKPPPSPRAGAGGAGRAGATMLSEQFRASMKEERKKFQEELREEQGRRRKAEDELRALKRGRGQGTSNASSLSTRGALSPR